MSTTDEQAAKAGRVMGALILLLLAITLLAWRLHPLRLAHEAVPPGYVAVTKVDDGDTIEANVAGKEERVRLIGVDTPETVDPRRPVQCFGKTASDFTKRNLTHQYVRLQKDETRVNEDRDKYGRLLRYVFTADGQLYNERLIREGYAHEYTYQNESYQYQAAFKAAESEARTAQRGLWSPNTCNGDTKKAADA